MLSPSVYFLFVDDFVLSSFSFSSVVSSSANLLVIFLIGVQ